MGHRHDKEWLFALARIVPKPLPPPPKKPHSAPSSSPKQPAAGTSPSDNQLAWLSPLGGVFFAVLVMPIAIEQYPDLFKENPLILPASVAVTLACWTAPLLFHRRIPRYYKWCVENLGLLITIVLIGGALWGTWTLTQRLYQFHIHRLAARLAHSAPSSPASSPSIPLPQTAHVDKADLQELEASIKKDLEAPKHTHVSYMSIPDLASHFNMTSLNIQPGKSFMIPLGFFNVGEFSVESTSSENACAPTAIANVDTIFYKVRKTFKFESAHGGTLPPHVPYGTYGTVDCPVTADIYKLFLERKAAFCGLSAVKWHDSTGAYETDYGQCLVMEPNLKNSNWHNIPQSNQELPIAAQKKAHRPKPQ